MKIQRKILIIILILVILVGASSILTSRFIATNIIKHQISENLLMTTQSRAKHIETILNQYINLTKTLASGNPIRDMLNDNIEKNWRTEQAKRRIESIINSHPEISRIRILNKGGIIIASSHDDTGEDRSDEEIYLIGKQNVFIKDLHISNFTQKYVLSIAAPISTDEQFSGILVVNFDADKELFQITTARFSSKETGETYLVNKNDYMISPSRFIEDVILKQKIDYQYHYGKEAIELPFEQLRSETGIITDYRGEEVLSAITPIPIMSWLLIAEIDTSEAFAPVLHLTNTLISIFLLVILLGILLSDITSRTIIQPVKKLYAGTKQVIKGNLDFKVHTQSKDEIGLLSQAFDEMTANLKKSREKLEEHSENLEKIVLERTSALEEDIKIRKNIEEVLRKEKEFTDTLIDTAQAIVLVLDLEGNIIRFNHFMEEISGFHLSDVKDKSWFDIFLPERNRTKTKNVFSKIIKGLPVKSNKNSILTKNGRKVMIDWHNKPLKDENGKTIGLLSIGLDITEQNKLQKALKVSEERFSFALDATNDGVWDHNLKTGEMYLSNSYYRMLGYAPGEIDINSKDFENFLHPDDKENVLKKINACLENKTDDYHAEFRMKTKSGHWKWILGRGKVESRDSHGKALRFLGTHLDISLRRQMEEDLRSSREKFANLFQNNPEAAVYTDARGIIIDINDRFTSLFGYTLDEVKGKNINSGIIHPQDKRDEAKKLLKKIVDGEYFSFESNRKKKDGTVFPAYITASSLVVEGKNRGMIALYRDFTAKNKMEKKLEKLARIDSLTGVYNRGYGLEMLSRQLKLSKRNKSPLLLAFLDIDGFKLINDNFGHDEGDFVLKKVSELFKSTLREIDIICRMGGDEFILIFPDNSMEKAELLKERLHDDFIHLNEQIQKDYTIDFSIGFSEYSVEKPISLNQLIRIADQKMYDDKNTKKD